MGKPYYEFDSATFKEDLLSHYIVPAAHWFLRDESSPYLLPQVSGSSWECSLAIEFLINLHQSGKLDSALADNIKLKCIATTRWLLSQVRDEGNGEASWDGVQWDTAVACRSVVRMGKLFSTDFASAEIVQIADIVKRVSLWLVGRVQKWGTDTRYLAGPPDLAQVLSTLIFLTRDDPKIVSAAEAARGLTSGQSSIDDAARLLIAMAETETVPSDRRGEPSQDLTVWVDAFNSSEVIDALSQYCMFCREVRPENQRPHLELASSLIYSCIRYVECVQSEGTWGGVADTCGTLYGYLNVIERMPNVSHQDHIVFKALRWMCDGNQSLDDGSFLHTAYVTVFYALALWRTYESWELGLRSTAEVYDVALWLAPNLVSHERSRRLDLELVLDDLRIQIEGAYESRVWRITNVGTWLILLTSLIAVVSALTLAGIIDVNLTLQLTDLAGLLGVLGVAVTVVPVLVVAFRVMMRRRLSGGQPTRKALQSGRAYEG